MRSTFERRRQRRRARPSCVRGLLRFRRCGAIPSLAPPTVRAADRCHRPDRQSHAAFSGGAGRRDDAGSRGPRRAFAPRAGPRSGTQSEAAFPKEHPSRRPAPSTSCLCPAWFFRPANHLFGWSKTAVQKRFAPVGGRPPFGRLGRFGSRGWIFSHWASVSKRPYRAIGPPLAPLPSVIAHFGQTKITHSVCEVLSALARRHKRSRGQNINEKETESDGD